MPSTEVTPRASGFSARQVLSSAPQSVAPDDLEARCSAGSSALRALTMVPITISGTSPAPASDEKQIDKRVCYSAGSVQRLGLYCGPNLSRYSMELTNPLTIVRKSVGCAFR